MALRNTLLVLNLVPAFGVLLAVGCGGSSQGSPPEETSSCSSDSECTDHRACNGVERCREGQCTSGASVICQAQDACHAVGTCNDETGLCTNPPAQDGKACDDGNACTTADACSNGVCQGRVVECVATPCHWAGVCDRLTGTCQSQPVADGTACDDGSACTTGDACVAGACQGLAVTCAAADDCHQPGTCDPTTGACSSPPKPDGSGCSDGNACTSGDACVAGVCLAGTPISCAAVDACHQAGACDPVTGACSSPPKPDGSACDDSNACTSADVCVAGACTGVATTCVAADACHQAGTCDPNTGVCSSPLQPDGTSCDDGIPCTTADACSTGSCVGAPVVCAPIDACHEAGTCIAATGQCEPGNQKSDGSSCDDGESCSVTSTCQAGLCQPTALAADETPCDDGSACSVIDTCSNGRCVGHHAPVCGGALSCPLAGSCVPTCGDGVLAATEACDEGSGASEGCTADCKLDIAPVDYDVSGIGSVFAVYLEGDALMGRCFGPSGAPRGPAFQIAAGSVVLPQVVTASTSGKSLVSYLAGTAPNTWARTSRLYDSACKPLGAAFAWDAPPSAQSAFDAAIDAEGNSCVLWTEYSSGSTSAMLSFYDASGQVQGTKLTVDSASRCENSYGMRVVVSSTGGSGVVTCQKHAGDPIYYRRFSNRAWTDSAMLEVPGTSGQSSWYQSHSVGMNAAGDFLVVWQNYEQRAYEAVLFGAATGFAQPFTLGWVTGDGYDGYPRGTRAVQVHGSNFAVMDGETPNHTVRLLSSIGELRGCDVETGSLLRTAGREVAYTVSSGIQRASVDFSSWNGCTRPTCGNGSPDVGEECDDGNRDPLDGCDEFCKKETCGDGLVTDGEACDEGALLPTSTCSSTCQWSATVPPVSESFPSGSLDFDVASDGTFIDTYIADNRVWARCYAADRKPLRQAFPITSPRSYESAQVVMAWSSRRSLVAWLQGGKLWGTLIDAACNRVGPAKELLADAVDHEGWAVAMDGEGRFTAAALASDGEVHSAFFDAAGVRLGPEHVSSLHETLYAPRIGMNRLAGGGVVTVQEHSGANAVHYRRFDAEGTWIDSDFAPVPVDYVYWYAGYTVGMNELGEFVVMYRAEGGSMKAVFASSSAVFAAPVTFSSRTRTGDTTFYDSFRGYRSPVPLKGNAFVLAEVYGNASSAADRTTNYFVYSPAGELVSSYESTWSDGKFTARLDGNGVSYIGANGTVYFGTGRL